MTDKQIKDLTVNPAPALTDKIAVDNAANVSYYETLSSVMNLNPMRVRGTVGYPRGYYTAVRPQIPMFRADAALTITRIHIHCADLSPSTELAGDLKFADDINTGSFANATVIDVCDTTSGVFTATSGFDDATVPSGKYVYFQMDAAPSSDITDFYLEVFYIYD